jgi:hypothetical protein
LSSLRITAANRAPEPSRPSATAQADSSPGTTSFPEALGSAVNAVEMTQTSCGGSPKTSERQERVAGKEAVAGSVTRPAHKTPARTANNPDLQSQNGWNHSLGLGAAAPASAAIQTTVPSGSGQESISEQPNGKQTPPAKTKHEDALQGALPVRRGPGASMQNVPAALIVDNTAEIPSASRSPEESRSSQIASANLSGSPAIDKFRAGFSVESDGSGPVAVSSLASGTPLVDPPAGWTRPEMAADSFAQLSPRMSLAHDQAAVPNDSVTTAAAGVAPASPSADPAGAAVPDISGFSLAFSDSSGIDPDPDALGRPFATAAAPMGSDDNLSDAPLQSAPRSGEDYHATAAPSLAADLQISLAGNAAPGGLPIEGSTTSSASSLSPSSLSEQLFHHVIGSVDNGGREVVLQLHPPELGDLTVRVLLNGREVSTWFASPQIQVQQAISQAIGQLQTDLRNAGYNLTGAWVGADASSPREWDGRSPMPQPQRGGTANRLSPERAPGSPSLSAASGVSVYV